MTSVDEEIIVYLIMYNCLITSIVVVLWLGDMGGSIRAGALKKLNKLIKKAGSSF